MTKADDAAQDAALRARLSGDIWKRSPFHRGRLERAGIGKNGIRHRRDLPRLPPMLLDDVPRLSTLLLVDQASQSRAGKPSHEEQYSPVQWITSGPVPMAYSQVDLDQLAHLGQCWLEGAGLVSGDLVASLVPADMAREHLQLTLGARQARVATVSISGTHDVSHLQALCPTAVAGQARDLVRLFEAVGDEALASVHTVLLVGEQPTVRQLRRIVDHAAANPAIVWAWAPHGVLSVWAQCRGGSGLHTWPDAEIVEIIDPVSGLSVGLPEGSSSVRSPVHSQVDGDLSSTDAEPVSVGGQLVWTGIGWFATAVVRLRTDSLVRVGSGPCEACGRESLRLVPDVSVRGFSDILNRNSHIDSWAAELRQAPGGDQLAMWIALSDPSLAVAVLEELNETIGAAQIVVVSPQEIDHRLREATGERFVDRRAVIDETLAH